MAMVSNSHSRYIDPETYLNPPSASFDAGASPLALLEKTCQSVGTDPAHKGSAILPIASSSPAKKDGTSQSSPDKLKSPSDAAKGKLSSPKTDRASSTGGGGKTDENGNKTKEAGGGGDGGKASSSRPTSAPSEPGASSQPIPPSLPSLPTPSRPAMPPFPSYPGFPHPFPSAFPHSAFPFSPYSPLAAFPRPSMPCMDLNCKTCPPGAAHGHQDLASLWLPSSPYASFFSPPGPSHFPPSVSNPALPHFCNWVTHDSGICGKRFATSDDLLQHVRSHTSAPETPASSSSSASSASASSGSGSSSAATSTSAPSSSVTSLASSVASSLSRPTPNPMLSLGSPMSSAGGRLSPRSTYALFASRYHPYAKPPGGPGGAAAAVAFPSPFSPYSASALSALYAAQRLPGSLPHP